MKRRLLTIRDAPSSVHLRNVASMNPVRINLIEIHIISEDHQSKYREQQDYYAEQTASRLAVPREIPAMRGRRKIDPQQ